ncbi:DUF2516 family protein [Nocardioides montaniterrae]
MTWIPGMYFAAPINDTEFWIGIVVTFIVLAMKIFAFVSALMYSADAYVAADRWHKSGWTLVLAVSVLLQVVPLPLQIINLGFLVAACVFLADVRPALAGLRRR